MPPPSEATIASLLAQQEWVRRVARALTADAARADDLAQESWLAALRNPPAHTRNLRGWLAGLLRGKAREAARSGTRRARREEEHARELGSAARSPEESLERAELVRALVEGVLAQREPYRSALVLVYFEGLAPKEAAARLGVPDATLRSHVKRGLELVRERLDGRSGGDRSRWFASVAGLALARDGAVPFTPAASITTAGAAVGTGVFLMKTKIAVSAVLLLVLAWFGWSRLVDAPVTERRVAPTASSVELEEERIARLPVLPAERVPLATDDVVTNAAVAAGTTGTLELELVFERDGRPAASERIEVATFDAVWRATRVELVTDGDGRARVEGLRPGSVRVLPARGGVARFDVAAGETRRERIVLPRGLLLRGRVVSAEGTPVPGASIVLAHGGVNDVREVARADADGRFELVDLGAHRSIGARCDGYEPSWAIEFEEHLVEAAASAVKPSARELVLVLRGRGGAVAGRVVDVEGRGVVGARVAIGPERPHSVESLPGTWGTVLAAATATTTADGRFRLDGLAPGSQDVRIEAAGFPLHSRTVDVPRGGAAEVEFVLTRAGVLAGRVTTEDGAPAGGVQVELHPATLHGARTTTDGLGFFRVEGLAPGLHPLVAGSVALGRKEAKVEIHAGEEQRVEIVLERGRALRGRVLDVDGHPLAYWRVRVEVAQDRYTNEQYTELQSWPAGWNETTTGPDGAFTITGLPALAFRLEVRRPASASSGHGQPLHVLEPVTPPSDELVLRVDARSEPAAWITGLAADAEGRPLAGAAIGALLASEGNGGIVTPGTVEPSTGRFRIGPLMAGTYRLHGSAPGFLHAYLATAAVAHGETQELGAVQLRPAARLLVRIVNASREDLEGLRVRCASDVERVLELRLGERFDSGAIAPGRYRLYVERDGVVDRTRAVELDVRAGEPTEVELDARGS